MASWVGAGRGRRHRARCLPVVGRVGEGRVGVVVGAAAASIAIRC